VGMITNLNNCHRVLVLLKGGNVNG